MTIAGVTTLKDWLGLLEQRHVQQPIQLGLDRVQQVLRSLNKQTQAVVITVAGTNGKGSVCAMLESILLSASYRVACYTSPHLIHYNERIRCNGKAIDDHALVQSLNHVEQVRGQCDLTYFEHATLAAWNFFCDQSLDVIILEVGMGGRLDAVNAIESDCAIVTTVSLDHQQYLGNTREQIAYEKAGIYRSAKPAICGDPFPPETLVQYADKIGAQLLISGQHFGYSPQLNQWQYWSKLPIDDGQKNQKTGLAYPGLRGENQLLNASMVITALECLKGRLPVPMQTLREGLLTVQLEARFQVLPGRPTMVLDVAHNQQAISMLAKNLSAMGFYPKTWALCAMLIDKDIEHAMGEICKEGIITNWVTCDLQGARGQTAEQMADRLHVAGVSDVACFSDCQQAMQFIMEHAQENDRIVIFGSFLTVSAVLKWLKEN